MPSININVIKFKFADKVVVFTRFELFGYLHTIQGFFRDGGIMWFLCAEK